MDKGGKRRTTVESARRGSSFAFFFSAPLSAAPARHAGTARPSLPCRTGPGHAIITAGFPRPPGVAVMPRRCSALAALLLFVAAAPAADKKLVIRWHGQSFFEVVSTQGTRIVLDPHAIEAYGRKEVPADLVLM